MSEKIEKKIQRALKEIRPHLQMDGGDVEFIKFYEDTGILEVRMQGACMGCPMSQITLTDGIGKAVMEKVSEVKKVIAV